MNSLYEQIPLEMRLARRWVGARVEPRSDRLTKIPYCAFAPERRASSTDLRTWTDFATAEHAVALGHLPLLGFMLGSPFMGADLDGCRRPETGVIEPWATTIIERLDSYTEASVSGTGVHIIALGSLPPGRRRTGKDGACPSVPLGRELEMYDSVRFLVTTGATVRESTLVMRTREFSALHAGIFQQSEQFDSSDRRGTENITDADLGRALSDDEVLTRAAAAANGNKFLRLWRGDLSDYHRDHSTADLALCSILLFWTHGDREQADRLFRLSGLVRDKWTDRDDYRARTFQKASAS